MININKTDLYIFFGPPGSGKTTQAILLEKQFGFKYISWGQISREIMSTGGKYPEFKAKLLDSLKGDKKLPKGLVSIVIENEIKRVIKSYSPNGIIIDGFPRYLDEAEDLLEIIDRQNLIVRSVISFNIFYPNVLERIRSRVTCEKCGRFYNNIIQPKFEGVCDEDGSSLVKRFDDQTEDKVKSRYDIYVDSSVDAIRMLTENAQTSFSLDANQQEPIIFAELVNKLNREHRSTHSLYKKTGETKLPTRFGTFKLIGYQNRVNYEYHLVMVVGNVSGKRHVPVRIHSSCITGDIFHSEKCDCGDQLSSAMEYVQRVGHGVVIYLFQEGRGINIINKIDAYNLQEQGKDTVEANEALNFPNDLRNYDVVRSMISDLGIKSIDLITNNPSKMGELQSLGLIIENRIPIIVPTNDNNSAYMKTKQQKTNHMLDKKEEMKNNIEAEIKFPLTDAQVMFVRQRISELSGALFEGKFFEKTNNYDNKDSTISKEDARLRIREISKTKEDTLKKIEFCYKRRLSTNGIKKEEEIETSFSADSSVFVQIINKMGYEFVDGYERFRETYKYDDTKITIDTFPFGVLLEVEGEDMNILKVVESLGLGQNKSYDLSCDDFYSYLCKKSNIKPKNYISFDDNQMPRYEEGLNY